MTHIYSYARSDDKSRLVLGASVMGGKVTPGDSKTVNAQYVPLSVVFHLDCYITYEYVLVFIL